MEASIIKKILWDHFEGRRTPPQKQILLEWLKDPSHQELFFELLHEWEKSSPQVLPDLQTDWDKILVRLDSSSEEETNVFINAKAAQSRKIKYLNALVAASVIVLLMSGWWQRDRILYKTYSSEFGETKSFALSDGSRVMLNADSKLMYPRFKWFHPHREVKLWGEAEFSVIHTRDHRPFLVRTSDQLEVRVLGTEFMVYSRKEQSKVVLTKGKVQLRSLKTNEPVMNIRPGDVVTVNRQGSIHLNKAENVTDHLAWKEHRFVFNSTSLENIAIQIQERFGVQIEIPDTSLAATRLSGYYPAENVDELISMLTRLLNVKSEKMDNNTIRITN